MGGEMTYSWKGEGFELAELIEPMDAIASGTTVGKVEGLIWSDMSGLDIVSVIVHGSHVAVPVEGDTWRDAPVVDLKISQGMLSEAPEVRDLEATGGVNAVELVSRHFSMPLSGPPPGPTPGRLPPWWHKGTPGDPEPGDDPTPLVG